MHARPVLQRAPSERRTEGEPRRSREVARARGGQGVQSGAVRMLWAVYARSDTREVIERQSQDAAAPEHSASFNSGEGPLGEL